MLLKWKYIWHIYDWSKDGIYEPLQETEENVNVQIERSRNIESNEEKMKENLKKLHA